MTERIKIEEYIGSISLRNRLMAVIALLAMNLIWFGYQAFASSTFSGDRLAAAAKALLHERFGDELDISIPLPPSDQYFDSDNIDAELIIDSKTLSRHMHLTALFYKDGHQERKIAITAQVKEMVLLPVAVKTLRKGEKISADQFDFKKIDRLTLGTAVHTSREALIGKTLLYDVRQDEPFPVDYITDGTKVTRGEEVELVVIKGTIKVRATATALEDGLPGQQIRLERKGSKQIITATLDQYGRALMMD